MNKNVICLTVLFLLQFFATSCTFCSCGKIKTFETKYTAINLNTWDTSGFQNKEISEFVYKNTFGISISMESESEEIARCKKPKFDISSLGFSAAYACSCAPDKYINNDVINSIQILVTNLVNNEVTDITNNFTTYSKYGEYVTIKEYIESLETNNDYFEYNSNDYFQLDMTEYNNIPDTAIFTIRIFLTSGAEFFSKTQEIKFK